MSMIVGLEWLYTDGIKVTPLIIMAFAAYYINKEIKC